MKRALVYPLALIAFGTVTGSPLLFNFLGLAIYVCLVRDCGRYVIPWPGVRRWMRLDKIDIPSPPPPRRDAEIAKYLFNEDRPGHWAVTPNPSWRDDT